MPLETRAGLKILTQMAKEYVYIQNFKAKGYNGATCTIPFYFSGYIASGNVYVAFSGLQPHTTVLSVIPRGRVATELWIALERCLTTLTYAGFWMMRPFDSVFMNMKSNGSSVPVILPFCDIDPCTVVEIPRQIHRDIVRELDKGTSITRAVMASVLPHWVSQTMRSYDVHLGGPLEFLHSIGTRIDLKSPSGFNTSTIQRFLEEMTPFMRMRSQSPQRQEHSAQSLKRQDVKNLFKTIGLNSNTNLTKLSSGTYGTAYSVTVSPKSLGVLAKMQRLMTHRTLISKPPNGTTHIIMKIERLTSRNPTQIDDVVREARTHATVSQSIVTKNGKKIRGRDVAPQLYFAGIYGGYNIICMEYIKGTPLGRYFNERKVSKQLFANLEHMVETLLRIGVVHGDMNGGNVIVLPDETVKCIDFGFSYEIPQDVHKKAVDILNKTGSIERAWIESGLQDVTDARYRRYNYYFSNLKMLQFARKMV